MGRSIKFAALAIALVLSGQARAGVAVFDFDSTGTITFVNGSSAGTTDFTYSSPVVPADTPNQVLEFTPDVPGTMTIPATGNNTGSASGNHYLSMTPSGPSPQNAGVDISLSIPASSVSFSYFLSTTGTVSTGITFTAFDTNDNQIAGGIFNPGLAGSAPAVYTAPVGSLIGFVIISTSQGVPPSGRGVTTLQLDDIMTTQVPEIDPASAAGALTLMGSAVVMFRGRRKAVRA